MFCPIYAIIPNTILLDGPIDATGKILFPQSNHLWKCIYIYQEFINIVIVKNTCHVTMFMKSAYAYIHVWICKYREHCYTTMFMKQMMFMISWYLYWFHLFIWSCWSARMDNMAFTVILPNRFTLSILALQCSSLWQNVINMLTFPRLSVNCRYKRTRCLPRLFPLTVLTWR